VAAVTITLAGVCSGGNHLRFTISGAASGTVDAELSDLTAPVTETEREAFIKVLVKLARSGRTLAQTRSLLQSGVTVTV